jgi:SAM-dependent methyltransferase
MHVIETLFPDYRSLRVFESSPGGRGASVKLAREVSDYSASFYRAGLPLGEVDPATGWPNEDLENLTLDDETVDLVITQDVLEHIFNPERAFAEIARVLRPGGAHVFTTPLVNGTKPSERWATLSDDGTVDYLHPPEFHGNPIDSEGSLVTMHWGYDVCEWVHRASGLFTTIVKIDNLSLGIRAEYIEVLVTAKPS